MSYDWDELEDYAAAMSTPASELFRRLDAETRETQSTPSMMVGPVQGEFLRILTAAVRPKLALEIGTFTGWSTIAIASGLPDGGRLLALDVNPETTAIARRYAEEAGVADRIEFFLGRALDTLGSIDGPFDLVFIDADKGGYVDYYEAVLPKLADDGLILADNTFYGLDDPDGPIARFNEHVRDDPRVEQVLVTIREGVTLIRRARA
jgi:caffeoyl-CoA O-methyltransferase